ncbi:MAG: MBL fold metallo-hydrolase [Deltaproteobacteria bacterium]|nr:MBL fold metallo-hydrolase [Deltaproteobacteria bacterium]
MPVFFRSTGTVQGPGFYLRRHGSLAMVRMPVTCAVLDRPGGLTLIDTGWSRRQCAWPGTDPGQVTRALLGLRVAPEDALASQLISCGLVPEDVKHIIATHLHLDHISGAVDFPDATVHTTPEEWSCLRRGRLRGYTRDTAGLEPRVERHALKGPAMLGFPASHDLFGDGSVLLLDARGHTLGSVAVAVKLDEGWLLHAGDAVMFREDYNDPALTAPSLYARMNAHDVLRQREGFGRFREAEATHAARVVPSHDPAVFEALPKTREDGWKAHWDKKPPKAPPPQKGPRPERPPKQKGPRNDPGGARNDPPGSNGAPERGTTSKDPQ